MRYKVAILLALLSLPSLAWEYDYNETQARFDKQKAQQVNKEFNEALLFQLQQNAKHDKEIKDLLEDLQDEIESKE